MEYLILRSSVIYLKVELIDCFRSQRFFIHVAKPALSYCLSTLQTDDSAIYKSLIKAATALDPSEAL